MVSIKQLLQAVARNSATLRKLGWQRPCNEYSSQDLSFVAEDSAQEILRTPSKSPLYLRVTQVVDPSDHQVLSYRGRAAMRHLILPKQSQHQHLPMRVEMCIPMETASWAFIT
eukprot:5342705-Amphidinium_carterae.2